MTDDVAYGPPLFRDWFLDAVGGAFSLPCAAWTPPIDRHRMMIYTLDHDGYLVCGKDIDDDRILIDLTSSGGIIAPMNDLFFEQLVQPPAPVVRDQSYLAHDPTKAHRRRRGGKRS